MNRKNDTIVKIICKRCYTDIAVGGTKPFKQALKIINAYKCKCGKEIKKRPPAS